MTGAHANKGKHTRLSDNVVVNVKLSKANVLYFFAVCLCI
jgi:hypothetical protein